MLKDYALLCQNCDKLGDSLAEFKGEVCSGQRAVELQRELAAALATQRKLAILKELEAERGRLVALMSRKRKGSPSALC